MPLLVVVYVNALVEDPAIKAIQFLICRLSLVLGTETYSTRITALTELFGTGINSYSYFIQDDSRVPHIPNT